MTRSYAVKTSLGWVLGAAAAALLALVALPGRQAYPRDDAGGALELEFVFGSEKKSWLEDVTKAFEASAPTVAGRAVKIKLAPMGSGETVDLLIKGERKPHLISPASGAYLTLGNAEAKEKNQPELVAGEVQNLVLSPVVIAMWKSRAEALGWPSKPIGWKDLHDLAQSPDGWGSRGHPDWGSFKFGHTHPYYSNSGLIALFAQLYAATGKKRLTVDDVEAPASARFLGDLQRSVVHYGESTGFFAEKMFSNTPDFLSAAVMYESLVVESYGPKWQGKLAEPVVAIYPKEGTFWSDHPVGIVQRPWVTPAHKEAAKLYIDFLLKREQQVKALKYGFRPGVDSVETGSPIDPAHGADPNRPGPGEVLRPPDVDVMRACLKAWRQNKKNARVVLVFDKSGSMRKDGKLVNAKEGVKEILKALGDDDSLALLAFSDKLEWVERGGKLRSKRARMEKAVNDLQAKGQTALYDAVAAAQKYLQAWPDQDSISAIVVLTDGADNRSKLKLPDLIQRIKVDNRTNVTRVFTIAYGSDADPKVLKEIADATQAKAYEGTPQNIRKVAKEIGTFF